MPTINATAFPNEAYVLVEVDWNDNPTVEYARVTRRNTVTGEVVTLRPHIAYDADGNLLLNCGLGIWWDTEPPLNVPLEYCTVAADTQMILNENPGFETGLAPWVGVSGTLDQSNSFEHSGSFVGRIQASGTGSPMIESTATFALTGGVEATLSGWTRGSAAWNGAQLHLRMTLSNGTVQNIFSDVALLDAGEYFYIEQKFTPALDATVTLMEVIWLGMPAAGATYRIDDFQVTQALPVAATVCDTVTVVSESVWLKNPLHPCLDVEIGLCDPGVVDSCGEDVRVSYGGMRDEEYDPNTVLLYPVNRRRPIPVNRVRRDVRSTLDLITHDCDARDAVLAANEPGDPLFFQAPTEYCIPDRYMSVATVTVSKFSVDQRDRFRWIELPHVAVDRPEGPADGPCGTRITDLCDIYATWGAMEIAGLDWEDLPTGGASNNSPGDPPIATLRTWGEVEAEFPNWLAVEAGGTRDWGELRDGL